MADPSSPPEAPKTAASATPVPRRRRRSRLAVGGVLWLAAHLLGLALIVGLGFVFLTGPAVQRLAPSLAAALGLPLDRVERVDLDPPRLVLRGVSLADGAVTAERIVADIAGFDRVRAFLGGEGEAPLLTRLTVDGVAVRGRIDGDGRLVIPGLTDGAGGGGGLPLPVMGPIALSGTLDFATPVGPVGATLDLHGQGTGDGVRIAGPVSVTAPAVPLPRMGIPALADEIAAVTASADLHVTVEPDGPIGVALEGLSGGATAAGFDLALLDGWSDVAMGRGRTPDLALSATLALDPSQPDGLQAAPLRLALHAQGAVDPNRSDFRLLLTGDGVSASIDRTPERFAVTVELPDLVAAERTLLDWEALLGFRSRRADPTPPIPGRMAATLDRPLPFGPGALTGGPLLDLLEGRLRISVGDVDTGRVRVATARLEADLVRDAAGSWSAMGRGTPWTLTGAEYGGFPPVTVLLEGTDLPQRVTVGPDGTVDAAGGLWVESDLGVGGATLTATGAPYRREVRLTDLVTGPLRLGDVTARLESREIRVISAPPLTSVIAPLVARIEPGRLGPVGWSSALAAGRVAVSTGRGLTIASTREPVRIVLQEMTAPAGLRAVAPIAVALDGDASLAPGGRLSVSATLSPAGAGEDSTVVGPVGLTGPTGPTLGPLSVMLPTLRIAAEGPTAGPFDLTLDLEGGRAVAARPGIAVSPLAASATAVLAGSETTGTLTVPGVSVDIDALPPALTPLRLGGRFDLAEASLAGGGTITSGPLSFPFRARHRLGDGIGGLTVAETAVRLGPDGVLPTDLLDAAAFPGAIDPAFLSADMTLGATLGWGRSGLRSGTIDLGIANGSLDMPMPTVTGFSVAARYDLLSRRLTEPAILSADRLAAKLVLEDIRLTVGQPTSDSIRLEGLTGTLAQGTLGLDPVTLPLDPLLGTVRLTVDGARLSQLLDIVPLQGLTATAPVSGIIPVQLTGAGVRIVDAALAADEPGRIVYRPETRPGWADRNASLTLLFDALEDFRFERLVATLAGDPLADLTLGFDVEGANPAVYGGYPIALGVNVEGPLMDILGRTINLNLSEDQLRELLRDGSLFTPTDPPTEGGLP